MPLNKNFEKGVFLIKIEAPLYASMCFAIFFCEQPQINITEEFFGIVIVQNDVCGEKSISQKKT
jgi:hypothetical protein